VIHDTACMISLIEENSSRGSQRIVNAN